MLNYLWPDFDVALAAGLVCVLTIRQLFGININMVDFDKRYFFRRETSNIVFYRGDGIKGIGRTQNISLKGALIETNKKPPPVSSHLELSIGVEEFYGLTAKVVWVKRASIDKWYFGVKFDNIQKFPALNIR